MQPLSPAFIDQLRFNEAGLIPAIAQDWLDGAVLMVAWMNRESIQQTLNSGEAHYRSRSRQELCTEPPVVTPDPAFHPPRLRC